MRTADPPGLGFRYAVTEDAAAVAALVERAYRGPDAAKGWTTETHLLTGPRTGVAEIEHIVVDPDSRFVLAEAEGALVGCALVRHAGERAHFGMFAVDPARQTGGIGKALLSACEDVARQLWSAPVLTMSVISLRSDLIEWYRRRGYERTGTTEPFPFHDASGPLRTDFELVHLGKQL
ncbi:MAG: GNAT family N-acetyltransferase [Actinomycetes bacterium]